jgi:hypothetical protein
VPSFIVALEFCVVLKEFCVVECIVLPLSPLNFDAWNKEVALCELCSLFGNFKSLKVMNCFDWLKVHSLATSRDTIHHMFVIYQQNSEFFQEICKFQMCWCFGEKCPFTKKILAHLYFQI